MCVQKIIIIIIIIIIIRISIAPYPYAHGALQLNISNRKFCTLKNLINNKTQMYKNTS